MDWIVKNKRVPRQRAIVWAHALEKRTFFSHVSKEQPFRDAKFFYRWNPIADWKIIPTEEENEEEYDSIQFDSTVREVVSEKRSL